MTTLTRHMERTRAGRGQEWQNSRRRRRGAAAATSTAGALVRCPIAKPSGAVARAQPGGKVERSLVQRDAARGMRVEHEGGAKAAQVATEAARALRAFAVLMVGEGREQTKRRHNTLGHAHSAVADARISGKLGEGLLETGGRKGMRKANKTKKGSSRGDASCMSWWPAARRARTSAYEIFAAAASDARLCDDTVTTTANAGSARRARSSTELWCSSSTVSADVTQPLHARQSCSETLIALLTASVVVCWKPRTGADAGAGAGASMDPSGGACGCALSRVGRARDRIESRHGI